jgi:hypothetical protein
MSNVLPDEYVYEQASPETTAIATGLMKIWEKLGKPDDPMSATGFLVIDNIVQVWLRFYSDELEQFTKDIKQELTVERSVRESNKQGGYFMISYPPHLYQLLKAMFPDIKLQDKAFIKHFLFRYPQFKATQWKI